MKADSADIDQISLAESGLHIAWKDRHSSTFDLFWLRDNCYCPECGDRSQGKKRVSMLQMPDTPEVLQTRIDDEQNLHVTWSDNQHQSTYSGDWLRSHCYCDNCRSARKFRPQLWDSSIQNELPEFEFEKLVTNELTRLELLSQIVGKGFALVHGVPTHVSGFEKLLSTIGYTKETNYGRICHLKVTSEGKLLGDTNAPIPLHTDECYRHANPGMLSFHCLSTSEDGGGANLLADGFKLAESLREAHPEAFDLLCRVPMVSRRFHEDETDLRSASPVISVDYDGSIQGIRYNERSAAPMDLPPDLIPPAYQALRQWLKLTRIPAFQVRIVMQPGDAIVFDNQRVLHGRDEFNGNRHLLYAQLDLDEPHSRNRVLSRRHGYAKSVTYTHRGT